MSHELPDDWYDDHDGQRLVLNSEKVAAEIERLRAALKPFAEYYDLLERNGYLEGFDLISRQNGKVLGHAGIQAADFKAAKDAGAPGQ
jgi:hypothetical protein